MVRIAISPAAFQAIVATLPGNVGFENKRAENGDWYIWLPHDVLAMLNRARGPGESYSDVISGAGGGDRRPLSCVRPLVALKHAQGHRPSR
jgi:hypothetical protein